MAKFDDSASFSGLLDLAAEAVGGKALFTNDEFFAEKENLLKPGRGVFLPDEYTDRGKWMDGWESRRKRVPGHDFCIIKLGVPGVIRAFDIDTNHFLGNHPPFASVDATVASPGATAQELLDADWQTILPQAPLRPGSQNLFVAGSSRAFTHVRLNIFPDGGVARFRVYGDAAPSWGRVSDEVAASHVRPDEVDLAAVENGGLALACSDAFFGPMNNLIAPGRAVNMGGGWETRRKRQPGHDWILLRLGSAGEVGAIEVDTNHFKGNFPDRFSLSGTYAPLANITDLQAGLHPWKLLIPETKLSASHRHFYRDQIQARGPFTHVRLDIFPDGGVSRLRVFGNRKKSPAEILDVASESEAAELLAKCCGSSRWVRAMNARRPFVTLERLVVAADDAWSKASREDILEAFSHHPKIGANLDSLREKFKSSADWASSEQSGVAGAAEEVLQALARGNREYEERFGYLFIVFATGKSAPEMLDILTRRMTNAPDLELRVAAREQAKIMRLRLAKIGA